MNKLKKALVAGALALSIGSAGAVTSSVALPESAQALSYTVNKSCASGTAGIRVSNVFGNSSQVRLTVYAYGTSTIIGSMTVSPGETRTYITNRSAAKFYLYTAGGGFGYTPGCY